MGEACGQKTLASNKSQGKCKKKPSQSRPWVKNKDELNLEDATANNGGYPSRSIV